MLLRTRGRERGETARRLGRLLTGLAVVAGAAALFWACSKEGRTHGEYNNETPYLQVNEYLNERQMKEALLYAGNLDDGPDKILLRTWITLFDLDSAEVCSNVKAACADKHNNRKVSPNLAYRRYFVAATVLSAENVKAYSQSLEFVQKAANICKKDSTIGDENEISYLLGFLYSRQGRVIEGIKAYQECLKKTEGRNSETEVKAHLGMATFYHQWARRKEELNEMRKALHVANATDKMNIYTLFDLERSAGRTYEVNHDADSALYYYKQAFEIAVVEDMTFYIETLKKSILSLQSENRGATSHANLTDGLESDKELRKIINSKMKEQKTVTDNLNINLQHEAKQNKLLLMTSLLLLVAIIAVVVYFERNSRRHKERVLKSESRIKEIEVVLEMQSLDVWQAERDSERFMNHFNAKYPNFIPALLQRNSDITKNDQLLCALLALGESGTAIQDIRHISKESFWAARYRIRTKLGLTHNDKLEDFLTQLLK